MSNSLLFIPDISGYTKFIQNTEIEHSEHVIAEILEVLIEANQENLMLAEVEGDALFFYKENDILTEKRLLSQIEIIYTAFFSHLKMLEKNRICTCNACATASNLRLKIIVHSGEMKFLNVHGNKKPFGNSVITTHRLLKNSIQADNYVLFTKDLLGDLKIEKIQTTKLFNFNDGADEYDGNKTDYSYSLIDPSRLSLKLFEEPYKVSFNKKPDLFFEDTFQVSMNLLLETITNYRYRHQWVDKVDSFDFNENEVTRLGTEHVCIINGKQLDFITVTKDASPNQIVYGEVTKSPPPVDELYTFFILETMNENSTKLRVEVYWKAKSLFKKILIAAIMKSLLQKNTLTSFRKLKALVENN